MILTLITPPVGEPVTLEEMKEHLLLETSDTSRDSLIFSYIMAARQQAEHRLNRPVRPATYQVELTQFTEKIYLPKQPVREIVSVSYLYNEVDTPLVSPYYTYYGVSELVPKSYIHIPTYSDYSTTQVKIQFKVGYEAEAEGLETIKAWIRLFAADLFENRQTMVTGTITSKLDFDVLLQSEKYYG